MLDSSRLMYKILVFIATVISVPACTIVCVVQLWNVWRCWRLRKACRPTRSIIIVICSWVISSFYGAATNIYRFYGFKFSGYSQYNAEIALWLIGGLFATNLMVYISVMTLLMERCFILYANGFKSKFSPWCSRVGMVLVPLIFVVFTALSAYDTPKGVTTTNLKPETICKSNCGFIRTETRAVICSINGVLSALLLYRLHQRKNSTFSGNPAEVVHAARTAALTQILFNIIPLIIKEIVDLLVDDAKGTMVMMTTLTFSLDAMYSCYVYTEIVGKAGTRCYVPRNSLFLSQRRSTLTSPVKKVHPIVF